MIKILYIINNFKQGGAQKHLFQVISGLDKTRFEPWLAVLDSESAPCPVEVPTENLNVKRIYDMDGLKGLIKLIKLIRKERFDVVHSYLFNENILGSIAGKITGVPLIITSRRDTGIFFEKKPHYFLMYRLTNRLVDNIICVSEAVKRAVIKKEKVNPDKLEVIYNGVDLNKFSPKQKTITSYLKSALGIKEGDFVVGMISNANSSVIKGQKDFIEAARIVSQEVPVVKFLLIGSGPLLDSLKDQSAKCGLQDKVMFLGTRKDIPELLSIMDISVNASYSEGMSNTILQSMASGVPVVATAVDGNLETVVDGITGLLVPPKNPQAMAKAIIKILKDKCLAKSMGENARKVTEEKFTHQIMLGNMENLYRRLLKGKVAFIFSQFPCYDETFILREMNELKTAGLDILIYSIKPCKDKIIHKEAEGLTKDTSYLPLFSLGLCFINLFFALRHPLRYWSAFLQVFFGNLKSPNFFVKTLGLWMQAVGFAWLARRDKVYHVHGQWATFPATQAFIISKLNRIPFSFTGHAHDIYLDTTMLATKMKHAHFMTTCTVDNKKYLLKSIPQTKAEKIIVNYHGVDLEKFKAQGQSPSGTVPSQLKILSVGSLLECKGFDILIDACKILKDKGVKFNCTIAGGGHLEASLKQKVRDLGLDAEITLTGYITQDKLIPLYLQADAFALSMRSKVHWGIPNVLLEAMAAKVPVICTYLPSIPELVENKKTGFIIPEEDPKALAEILIKFYQEPQLRNDVGNAGYEIIKEKFDIKKNAKNLMDLFVGRRLNVLYVIPSLNPGGAERVVINLAARLDKSKFNTIVCCLNEKGRFAEELEKEGIEVIALNKKGPFDLIIISKLVRVMRENRIDVVNTHLWGANFWGRIAAKIAKVKVIIATEHNTDTWKNRLYFTFDRWLSRKTDKIIAVSNSVKEFYVSKGIAAEKIEVIYNGINVEGSRDCFAPSGLAMTQGDVNKDTRTQVKEEFNIKNGDIVLSIIGRLVEQKGHKYLFEALKEILENRDSPHRGQSLFSIKLFVVGDGPLFESLQSTVNRQQLQNKVIFTGLRKDVKDILGITDILVMPSLREGLPMVALEAMAQGVPIVASKVGGIPELIVDGQTGILVEPKNTVALKDALIRIIEDKNLAQQLRDNAKKRVKEEFSLEKMLNKTQEVFEECLARM